jgi:antibiotic biosynthesis monooxygenase (ABM) superfamily enzyme
VGQVQGGDDPGRVTHIATRRAKPGREADYESLISELFAVMRQQPGFRGAELIPPTVAGGDYQVVTHFDSEEALAAWDASRERSGLLGRLREVADGEPDYCRLAGLEAWFAPVVVPASMHPPRHRMALVTWLGIWPTVSLVLWLLGPLWQRLHLPYLLVTALNTLLIVAVMTFVVMPRLTRWMRGFLTPSPSVAAAPRREGGAGSRR